MHKPITSINDLSRLVSRLHRCGEYDEHTCATLLRGIQELSAYKDRHIQQAAVTLRDYSIVRMAENGSPSDRLHYDAAHDVDSMCRGTARSVVGEDYTDEEIDTIKRIAIQDLER